MSAEAIEQELISVKESIETERPRRGSYNDGFLQGGLYYLRRARERAEEWERHASFGIERIPTDQLEEGFNEAHGESEER